MNQRPDPTTNLAVHAFGFTPSCVLNRSGWWVKDADERLHEVAHYTAPDYSGFAAMESKARELGWWPYMEPSLFEDGWWWVGIFAAKDRNGEHLGVSHAPTLPTAFARALLLAVASGL